MVAMVVFYDVCYGGCYGVAVALLGGCYGVSR